jgi:hypothetical protein
MHHTCPSLVIVLVMAAGCNSKQQVQAPPTPPPDRLPVLKTSDEVPETTADEIQSLIEQLHSPNEAPRLPSRKDIASQQWNALHKLCGIGVAAFPYLIETLRKKTIALR